MVVTTETGCCVNVEGGVVGGLSGIVMGASLVVGDAVVMLDLRWGMEMESGTEVGASE